MYTVPDEQVVRGLVAISQTVLEWLQAEQRVYDTKLRGASDPWVAGRNQGVTIFIEDLLSNIKIAKENAGLGGQTVKSAPIS